MAVAENHTQRATHTHLLLIGWVTVFLYGVFLKLHPAAQGKLAAVLWWIANIGTVVTVVGLYVLYSGNSDTGEPLTAAGSLTVLAGLILFSFIVWRTRE